MYGPLWRALPGRWPFKLVQICLLVVAVLAVCFLWLFPAIAPHLPFNENTVGTSQRSPLNPHQHATPRD